MIDRRPDSCDCAGFIAAVYTASILSTAATKRAAPSSVSVVAGPILESLRDGPPRTGSASRCRPVRYYLYYLPKLLTLERCRCCDRREARNVTPPERSLMSTT